MEEMNACTECGFTTKSIDMFTSHIEHHEEEHRSSSGELSQAQTLEWTAGSSSSSSSTPSPTGSLSEKTPSPAPRIALPQPTLVKTDLSESIISHMEKPIKVESTPKEVKSTKSAHVCPHCNFTTFMSQHMKSHLEAHERHQGQMYQCDICNMQFSQKANMHRHRMRHSGVKPYECRYCKKRFFRKDQMQEHSMTHIKTGADFDCPVALCKHQFSQHSQLRTHLDEDHSIAASSPASCKRCSLLFANSRRLLLHYQTRHDENETTSPQSPKMDVEGPPRKKKADVSAQFRLAEQIQQLVKQEVTCSTNNSSSLLETTLAEAQDVQETTHNSAVYPISNEDLLMMCLANTSGLAHSALMASNKISSDNGIRLWPSTPSTLGGPPQNEPHSPSFASASSNVDVVDEPATKPPNMECNHCGIVFFDQTMHLLHKGLHTENDPWRCNLCGHQCMEKYMFSTHIIFANHST